VDVLSNYSYKIRTEEKSIRRRGLRTVADERQLLQEIEELKGRIRELEQRVRDTERAELAIEAAGIDIWENNFVTGETFGTNRRCFLSLGYSEEELPDNLADTFKRIHPEDFAEGMKKVQSHFHGETPRYQAEMRVMAKNGSWVWFVNYGKVMERDSDGNVTRFIGITLNVDQRRIMEEKIKELAFKDPLTGLDNRRGFTEAGNSEVERALRYNHPMSLLMLDIDYFKEINDAFGHQAGDEVLKGLAGCINHILRKSDIKARWGGDEFILLLVETDREKAVELAERLRKQVSEWDFPIAGKVAVSIGLSSMEPSDTLDSIIRRADKALYLAKHYGRNRIEVI